MSERSFVHLHVHTHYSMLDGALKIPELMARCQELGMPAVAMTDHGNMYGAVEFQKAAKGAGLKSIIGCEVYLCEGVDRREDSSRKAYHVTLLAMNLEGYQNLTKIVSMAWLDGRHEVSGLPRADFELLREHAAGIICLSGDLAGEVNQYLLRGKKAEARAVAHKYREVFGDRYYIELMDGSLPEFKRCREGLIELARDMELPMVATNDCHYLTQQDALAHAILMCIGLGKSVDPDVVLSHGLDTLYVRSADEMWELFADVPEACENTLKIAARIDLKIPLGQVFLPRYKVPQAFVETVASEEPDAVLDAYFAHLSREGLEARFEEMRRFNVAFDEALYRERLEEEVRIIQQMKFPGYFLIVWDFINYAKQQGIPVGPGRGSGAGSLVAYVLSITDIDPMPYDLLFERFLNPERVSMPDFDIDFCMNRRGEVIDYVTRKYGEHNVGQIVTYGLLKARACVKDVGRALGMAYADTDRIAKMIPEELNITLQQSLDREPRLVAACEEDPKIKRVFDIALRLENMARQAGMHAAGIVISEEPLWHYVPICRGANGELVTQFAKNEVEEAGLVKFDFLGLKTLTVIDTAVKLINKGRAAEEPFQIRGIPMKDAPVFQMISKGNTTGVFQLESSGFQALLMKLKPDCFEDIVAAVALYRPGPLGTGMVDDFIDRKHGRKAIEYPYPTLEDTLKETYGTIVYQEQVMKIAQNMAGYSLGGADLLRRAMGKKKASEMDKQRSIFVTGSLEKQVPEAKANEVFDLMAYFAGYGFNKCVVGDTLLTHAETGEQVTVESLFRARRPFQVHALGEDERIHAREVSDVVWNGIKPVFELETELGHRITATGNHPFRTWERWTLLEELQPGDRIAVPRRLQVTAAADHWEDHALIVLGGLLSEGNTCHPSCLYFYNNDPEAIDDFAQAAVRFPETAARIAQRGRRMEVCLSTGRDTRFRSGQVPHNKQRSALALAEAAEPQRSGVWRWAEALDLVHHKADAKRMPLEVFSLPDAQLALLLGRLWTGDGFIANATQATTYYATSSRQLAQDVQTLLLRLGILSRVHTKRFRYRGGHRIGYTVHLLGEQSRAGFLKEVVPHIVGRREAIQHLEAWVERYGNTSNKDTVPIEVRAWVREERAAQGLSWSALEEASGVCLKEFMGEQANPRKGGFQRGTLAQLARALGSSRLERAATSDVYWDRVVRIEPKGDQHTYDLTVEVDHNFVANNIFVHNSHSAAYALITYQTGYLKVHYPVEFMAALMSCDRENTDKVVKFINEAKEMGIPVLPPDVNISDLDFSVASGEIRFGLGAIKGVGAGAIEEVLEQRSKKGAFRSLYDFCERVDLKKVNRKVLEAMIKSGAFDSIGLSGGDLSIYALASSRARMMGALSTAIDRGQRSQKDRQAGQSTLFGMFAQASPTPQATEEFYPEETPWTDKVLLSYERDAAGFYITGHPLDRYAHEIGIFATHKTNGLEGVRFREEVCVAAVVTSIREKIGKSGRRMAFLMVEDQQGMMEVLCFSDSWLEAEEAVKSDEPVLLYGEVKAEGEPGNRSFKLRLARAVLITDARREKVRKVCIELDADRTEARQIKALAATLRRFPGSCATELTLRVGSAEVSGRTTLALGEGFRVDPSDELLIAVEQLFGGRVVRLG